MTEKNENEIKRAFAMEVIALIDKKQHGLGKASEFYFALSEFKFAVQSLLPKEEEKRVPQKGDTWKHIRHNEEIIFDSIDGDKCFYNYKHLEGIASGSIDTFHDSFVFVKPKEEDVDYSNYSQKFAEIVEPDTKTETSREVNMDIQLKDSDFLISTKTESDEVKDKELMDYTNWLFDTHNLEANKNILAKYKSIKSQQSLEQNARKKAKELDKKYESRHDVTYHDVLTEALLIDPKTL